MSNPPPRPALRKAPDADVHPMAARPEAVVPDAPAGKLRPVTGLGGLTSDTLVSVAKKAKRVKLEVKVPKDVLKKARAAAKKRGEKVDDVVAAALQAYSRGR